MPDLYVIGRFITFCRDAWDVFEYHLYTGVSLNHDGEQEGTTTRMVNAPQIHRSASVSSPSICEASATFVSHGWGDEGSSIKQTIILAGNSKVLEFRTDVEWFESHKLLKVEFPLASKVHS